MKFSIKLKSNYLATIIDIKNIIDLEKCDNIKGTIIFGNHVIVSKDVKIGDVGIFFPVESEIAEEFLKANNLYRKKEMNSDIEKVGFFEATGRVRCVKLRGFKSEGFWIPIDALNYLGYNFENAAAYLNTEFDTVDGKMICKKYKIKRQQSQYKGPKNQKKKKLCWSKLLDTQFRFHIDTAQFGKNIHVFNPETIISCTYKVHGTSAIAANILCKRKLSWYERFLLKCGVKIVTQEYDNIYASRKVIKNAIEDKELNHFYKEDIWKTGNEELLPYIQKGMTVYYEICGYLQSGKAIQSDYDYGCSEKQHRNFIYRITSTNADGKVVEWSMLQVQQWCKQNGLEAVPMLYYGTVKDLIDNNWFEKVDYSDDRWRNIFLQVLMQHPNFYLEKDCYICKNQLPAEGIVIRKESLDIESYKLKSFRFRERETKLLDKGVENIEDNQEEITEEAI